MSSYGTVLGPWAAARISPRQGSPDHGPDVTESLLRYGCLGQTYHRQHILLPPPSPFKQVLCSVSPKGKLIPRFKDSRSDLSQHISLLSELSISPDTTPKPRGKAIGENITCNRGSFPRHPSQYQYHNHSKGKDCVNTVDFTKAHRVAAALMISPHNLQDPGSCPSSTTPTLNPKPKPQDLSHKPNNTTPLRNSEHLFRNTKASLHTQHCSLLLIRLLSAHHQSIHHPHQIAGTLGIPSGLLQRGKDRKERRHKSPLCQTKV